VWVERSVVSTAKLVVVVALVGAVVFGLFVGYLAYANDSFPAQTKPFGDYASVSSSTFNGTEFAINITWENGSAVPLYAQLSSPDTDAANTPVCDLGLSKVSGGMSIFMPFSISPASATLSDVQLRMAVNATSTGDEFTIVYTFPSVAASNASITPSNISCSEGPTIE
jgi:hypothetical protein